MLRNRNYSEETLDEFLRLDKEWRRLVDESNGLKHKRNVASERIPKLKGEEKKDAIAEMRGVAERIKQIDAMIADLEAQRDEVVLNIPNLPDASVPVGCDYAGNRTVSSFGKPRELDFTPKKHYEIGEDLDIIDFQRGAKITGSGFYILKGDGARLERALIQYMLDVHHDQGYREVFTPAIVNTAAVIGTGQYPKMKDDMYWCERDVWFPLPRWLPGRIFERESYRYRTRLSILRREAGRNADTRGIIRVHQFNKVELVKFVHPSTSFQELEVLRSDAEAVLRGLELPYRTLLLCTGDMGFASAKTYDLEAHSPGADQWLEVSSCSCFTDFQARRARIKFRPEPHLKSEFVHTLNGSGLALPRTMVAVLENYQNEDGTVTVPKVLRPYMKGQELIG